MIVRNRNLHNFAMDHKFHVELKIIMIIFNELQLSGLFPSSRRRRGNFIIV